MASVVNAFVVLIKWAAAQIEWLKGFFQDANGKPRMSAALRLLVTVIWCRAYILITRGGEKMPVIDWLDLALLLLVIGVATVEQIIKLMQMKYGGTNGAAGADNK